MSTVVCASRSDGSHAIYVVRPPAPQVETFDWIIVGAGPAGSIIAKNLAQDDRGDKTVLVLEAGEDQSDNPFVINPFSPTPGRPGINLTNAGDDVTTAFTLVSTVNTLAAQNPPALINRGINQTSDTHFHVGRMIGGGSGKNFLNAVRGSPEYHEDLAENWTDGGWTNWRDLYKSIERYVGQSQNPSTRGTQGEIFISRGTQGLLPAPGFVESDFAAAALAITGIPMVTDYNADVNTNTFYGGQQFIRFGQGPPTRSYAGNTYLGSDKIDEDGMGIGKWSKLRVSTKHTVTRLVFDEETPTRIAGVEAIANGEVVKRFMAREGVILSAGAIFNPPILQRSGIGPAAVLEPLNIPVRINNPNVGQHLLSHYGPVVVIETDRPKVGGVTAAPAVGAYLDITENGVQFNGTRRHVQMQALNGASPLVQDIEVTPGWSAFSFICWIMKQQSEGTIQVKSTDPLQYPENTTNMFIQRNGPDWSDTTPTTDMGKAINFMKFVRDLVNTMNAQLGGVHYRLLYPRPDDFVDDVQLAIAVTQAISMTDHATGTCRMGKANDDTRVVDDHLKVLGTDNLYCCDLSVLPLIPDGNTCLGAYLVGAKLTEFLTGATLSEVNPA